MDLEKIGVCVAESQLCFCSGGLDMLSLPSCSTRLEDLKSPFSSIGLSDDLEEFTEEYADKENLVLRFGYVKWRGGKRDA